MYSTNTWIAIFFFIKVHFIYFTRPQEMGRKTTLRGSASLYVCPSVSDMNRKYTRSLVTCDCEWLFAETGSSHRRQLGKVAFMGSPSLPSGSHPPTAAYYRARQDAGAPLDLTLRHCLCCKGRSGAEKHNSLLLLKACNFLSPAQTCLHVHSAMYNRNSSVLCNLCIIVNFQQHLQKTVED